jgi:hypothetical protein
MVARHSRKTLSSLPASAINSQSPWSEYYTIWQLVTSAFCQTLSQSQSKMTKMMFNIGWWNRLLSQTNYSAADTLGISPNPTLRQHYNKKSLGFLQEQLRQLDEKI